MSLVQAIGRLPLPGAGTGLGLCFRMPVSSCAHPVNGIPIVHMLGSLKSARGRKKHPPGNFPVSKHLNCVRQALLYPFSRNKSDI